MSGFASSRRRRRAALALLASTALAATTLVATPATAAQNATIPTPVSCAGTPVITSVAISPRTVNVKTASKSVTVTVKARDSKSAISYVSGSFTSPTISGVTRSAYGFFTRTAGTSTNGTWKAKVTIPRWTNNGTWKLSLSVSDVGGGYKSYYPGSPDWKSAWPKTIAVTSTPDVKKPTITGLSLSKKSVNTSSATKQVKITLKASDAKSGAKFGSVYVAYQSSTRSYGAFAFLTKTGGTTTKATLTGTMTIPRWQGATKRTWKTTSVSVYDAAGNSNSYSLAQLKAKGLARSLSVTSSSDTSKPTLSSFTFSPRSINVKTAAKKVSVTLKAKDTKSGVSFVTVNFTAPNGYGSYSAYLTRKSGTAASGTWSGSVTFPKCTPGAGTWKAKVSMYDKAGNSTQVSSGTLASRSFPVNLAVTSNDTLTPTAKVPTTVARAGGVLITFSEPTLWSGTAASLLEVSGGASYDGDIAGTWTCKNSAGTVVTCDANGANVKTAAFAPTVQFDPSESYYVQSRNYPSGIFDTSGNSLSYVSGSFTSAA